VDEQDRLSNMEAGQDSGQAEQYRYKQGRIPGKGRTGQA
jgi:hypothetical protein